MRTRAMAVLVALAPVMTGQTAARAQSAPPPGPADGTAPPAPPSSNEDLAGETATIDEALLGGETIVVEQRSDGPGTASGRQIDPDVIATTPHRSADDLLRLVPGLYISQHGSEGKGVQLFLRGFDAVHGSDVEVELAGIPLNELSNVHGQGYVDLGFIPPETVRSLRARKSSFALEQGNFATAGSLGFELGVEERGHRVSYESGTTNRHRLAAILAPAGQPAASFTAFEAMTDGGYGENRGSRRLSAISQRRVEWDHGDTWLELLGAGYAADFGEPGTTPLEDVERGAIGFDDTYDQDSRGRSMRALLGARAQRSGGGTVLTGQAHMAWRRLDLDENFTGFLLYPEQGDRRRQAHRSLSAGASGRLERDLSRHFTLVAGVEGLVDRVSQREDQIDTGGAAWQENRDLGAVHVLAAAHGGVRARLGRLEVEGGARVDGLLIDADDRIDQMRNGQSTFATLSPRLSTAWQLRPGWRLLAAYGRGLRAPEARAIGNPPAPPPDMDVTQYDGGQPHFTTSDAVEVGTELKSGRLYTLSASTFGIWISDEMVFDHLSGTNLALNSTRRLGVELGAELRPLDWLRLRADVTATDARFEDSGEPVPSVPALLASAELGALHPSGWRGGAQLFYLAPRPLAHGATAGDSAVLGLTAGRRFGRFDLDIAVDNALAAQWREGEYHYASWFDKSQPRSTIPRLHYSAGRPFGVRAALTAYF
jgi:iron complex outermembrane recepter protein